MRTHYPRGALSQGVGGIVVLRCKVAVAGKLKDCVIHEETPPGFGFGEAALQAAPELTALPGLPGVVPGATVQYSITFRPD